MASLLSIRSSHRRRHIPLNCSLPSHSPPSPTRTASSVSRRTASLALLLHCCSAPPEMIFSFSSPRFSGQADLQGLMIPHTDFGCSTAANAGSIFDEYVKRKKLGPLEAYVPAVLLTQAQFKDLDEILGSLIMFCFPSKK